MTITLHIFLGSQPPFKKRWFLVDDDKHLHYILKRKGASETNPWKMVLGLPGPGSFYFIHLYQNVSNPNHPYLGGVFFFCFICTPIPGEMLQFDEHIFSDGLKPPTRYGVFTIIYLHEWFIFTVNVGTYASPMDAMGYGFWAQVAGNLLRFFFTEPRYEAYGTYHPWDDCIWKPTINRWFYGNWRYPPRNLT